MAPLSRGSLRRRSGFTLVEIIVVAAIVAILAAILIPVAMSVRESARTATCASNLRQIGLAMQLYTRDSNGYYPNIAEPNGDNSCSWVDRVYPYTKAAQVFECPSHPDGEYRPGCPPSQDIPGGGGVTKAITYDGSYMLNALEPLVDRLSESRVRQPSSTIIVSDGVANWDTLGGNNYVILDTSQLSTLEGIRSGGVIERHRDGDNVLFCDYHVKWMRIDSLLKRSLWRADGRDKSLVTPTPAPSPAPTP